MPRQEAQGSIAEATASTEFSWGFEMLSGGDFHVFTQPVLWTAGNQAQQAVTDPLRAFTLVRFSPNNVSLFLQTRITAMFSTTPLSFHF